MRPGRIIVGLLVCILLGSCAGSRSARAPQHEKGLYTVTAAGAPFYHYSPRQGSGPDKTLDHDTALKLIRGSFSFCKIQLPGGEEGYVATNDIAPSSANPLLTQRATAPSIASTSSWRAEIPEPRSSAPEPPLPEFEPTPIPVPSNLDN